MKRREAKHKGEKKRYTHLNAEFQRLERRDKKAFLSDQYKEIEENNRMGKTRNLIKKLETLREYFMQSWAQYRTEMVSTQQKQRILRRDIKNIRTIQKRLHDPDNHNSVITHLETDILECIVKWALGSITSNKASGGDGIPVELFQILKDDAVMMLNMPANLESSAVAAGLEKVSFHSNPKEKQCQRMLKLLHNCTSLTC